MKKFIPTLVLAALLFSCDMPKEAPSSQETLNQIVEIVKNRKAQIGVAIENIDGDITLLVNSDRQYPLQSVFKYHIAVKVLSEVDKGNLSLNQEIEVSSKDLKNKKTWSPFRDANPNGGAFPLSVLMKYMIEESDNIACDILLELAGGPKAVEEFFHEHEIKDITITYNEADMQAKWERMYQNTASPQACTQSLKKFYKKKDQILSKESYDFLWDTMFNTQTGIKRLKGLLPADTRVAHKTGTSMTNKSGITGALNDIGIVIMPNGQPMFISVLIKDSAETEEVNESSIAEICKIAYDYFLKLE